MLLPPQHILEERNDNAAISNLARRERSATENEYSQNADTVTTSSTRSSLTPRGDHQDRHFIGRQRQRASSPLCNSSSTAEEGEKIQQVFFPPFEEAGQNGILDPPTHWPLTASGKLLLHYGEYSHRPSFPESIKEAGPKLAVSSGSSYARHTRSQSSDSTYISARSLFSGWGYAPNLATNQQTATSPSILRESGVLLNSNSDFAPAAFMLPDSSRDVHMEVHEMRLRFLRRAVTATEGTENHKPKLERSQTIASSRPTKRKAISTDLGSLGPPFASVTTTALGPSATVPQLSATSRNAKSRPPPLRELPPPSWSSPGHSPPLTALAPPFSRDMFLFPIKTGASSLPISPVNHQSFSSLMSPPITPNPRLLTNDIVTPTLFAPSALSMSHLSVNHHEMIDNHSLTVNRYRRRSSMSSFESTTETIRPWHACGQLTPKPSKAQLIAQAMEEDQSTIEPAFVHDHAPSMKHSQSDGGWTVAREKEKQAQPRRMDKKSRLAEKEEDFNMLRDKLKVSKRRAESRKVSATIRL